jgi:RNA-directed DNA polymerase
MSASSNHPEDKVRELQRTLWRAAKRSRGRRFHALYPGRMFLQRWPSPRSMKRLRTRIRALTDARHSGVKDVRVVIAGLNPVLRGWGNYFRTGNASLKFNQMDHYVRQRLGLLLARRHGLRDRHGAISRWSFDWFRGLGSIGCLRPTGGCSQEPP